MSDAAPIRLARAGHFSGATANRLIRRAPKRVSCFLLSDSGARERAVAEWFRQITSVPPRSPTQAWSPQRGVSSRRGVRKLPASTAAARVGARLTEISSDRRF